MKKHVLYWYYRIKICRIEGRIFCVRDFYAQRSSMSKRNFEFESIVEEEVKLYREKIFNLKRKMVNIR